MFLRHRFMWLIIAVSIVLVVSACSPELTSGVTEVLTAEQITAVGCDAAASEGQIKRCFATVIRCNPQDTELKMNECIVDKIDNVYDCGPVRDNGEQDARHPSEIASCMVEGIQSGEIPGGE